MRNDFLLTDNPSDIVKGNERGVTEFTVATRFPDRFNGLSGVTAYKIVEKAEDATSYPRLVLLSLSGEETVDSVIEAVYKNGAMLIVAAGYSLDETGAIEVRYHLSPVQLLHKIGLLERCSVVGGVHLDRDDVDLMAQCGTKLILCPTASMGYGYGFPHFVAAARKLKVTLGSGDNRFNKSGDMKREAETLVLGSNCDMRSSLSVSEKEAVELISSSNEGKLTLFE
jgi:cytosine/adenosine deaminase-related metal-dependent hydrolase